MKRQIRLSDQIVLSCVASGGSWTRPYEDGAKQISSSEALVDNARVIPFGTPFIPALAKDIVNAGRANDYSPLRRESDDVFVGAKNFSPLRKSGDIDQAERHDFSRTLVVFPGRRPALFLRREIARLVGGVFVPPQVLSMDAWMAQCATITADEKEIGGLDAAYAIFTLARDHAPDVLKHHQGFAAFLPWAREIFDIFEQAECELVPDERFERLTAHAEIGFALPPHIVELLARLGDLKRRLYASFAEKKIVTQGMRYRRAAENPVFADHERVIIANPSYFSAAEETVVRAYLAKGHTMIMLHGSAEEDNVIADLAKRTGIDASGPHGAHAGEIILHKAVGVQGQAVIARECVRNAAEHERTLVLLPAPDSLVPVVSEVSAVVSDMNVSLGYPVTRSALYALCTALFDLVSSRKGDAWYTKDYLAVVAHPLVKNLVFSDARDGSSLTRIAVHTSESVLTQTRTHDVAGAAFVSQDELESNEEIRDALAKAAVAQGLAAETFGGIMVSLHREVIAPWLAMRDVRGLAAAVKGLIGVLAARGTLKAYAVNEKCAEALLSFADECETAACGAEVFDIDALRAVFDETLRKTVSPFKGSPLKGLQVLGVMEARSLDFDEIVILDANEGVLPSLRRDHPLIPADALVQLGLKRIAEDERLQAYAFTRLLSSAKRVHLIYDDDDQKRRSRFVERIVWVHEQHANKIGVMPAATVRFANVPDARLPQVHKSPAVLAALSDMTFTPSMLDAYVRCPLCFYYRSVLKLREKEELADEPDSRAIGTLLHGFLEDAFRPLVGKDFELNGTFERHFWDCFDRKFREPVRRRMRAASFLVERVAEEKMRRFLAAERERGVAQIVALEHDLKGTIPSPMGPICVFGRADRIDRLTDGQLMVVDYKSGSAKKFQTTLDLSTRDAIKESRLKTQLPIYAYLAGQEFAAVYPNACLYDLRGSDISVKLFESQPQDFATGVQPYLDAIATLVREIRDPNLPFVKDDENVHRCV
jgi:CRISPR/Cas system-associated exonuclease Cas4 (RecB family)